jgi:hypothetical protein
MMGRVMLASTLLATMVSAQEAAARKPATAPATAPVQVPAGVKAAIRLGGGGANVVVGGGKAVAVGGQDQRAAQIENTKRYINTLQLAGKFKLSDLMKFSLVDGQFKMEWTNAVNTVNQQVRLQIEGSNATWVISQSTIGVQRNVNLVRYDFDRADGPWSISANLHPSALNIHSQWGPKSEVYNVSFSQSANQVMLSAVAMVQGRHQQRFQGSGANITELQTRNPEEVRMYLSPLLRDLCGVDLLRPGPADLYRVFEQLPADPQVSRQVAQILPKLESASFAEREAASAQLLALGRGGLLAVMRVDPATLSAEQRARLADLVAQASRRTLSSPAAMKRDVNFLLEAMEDEEAPVRVVAKAALQETLGRAVNYDPAAAPAQLAAAVVAIRRELAKADAPAPTTAPGAINAPVN